MLYDDSSTYEYVSEHFDARYATAVSRAAVGTEGLISYTDDPGNATMQSLDKAWEAKGGAVYPVSGVPSPSRGSVEFVDGDVFKAEVLAQQPSGSEFDEQSTGMGSEESLVLCPTDKVVAVKYLMVDDGEVTDGLTINDVYSRGLYGNIIGQQSGFAQLYRIDGNDGVYAAYATPSLSNGSGAGIIDAACALEDLDGQSVDGVAYDADTGIVYIPRSVVQEAGKKSSGIQFQFLQQMSLENESTQTASIDVRTSSSRPEVSESLIPEQSIEANVLDTDIQIPIFRDDSRPTGVALSLSDFKVAFNGMEVELTEDSALYDEESSRLILGYAPSGVSKISVRIADHRDVASQMVRFLTGADTASAAYWLGVGDISFYYDGRTFFDKINPSQLPIGKAFIYNAGMCNRGSTPSAAYGVSTAHGNESSEDAYMTQFANKIKNGASWDEIRVSPVPWHTTASSSSFFAEADGPFNKVIDGIDWHVYGDYSRVGLECSHAVSPVGYNVHPWGEEFTNDMFMRILKAENKGEWSYVILAFMSPNMHGLSPEARQSCVGIYKIRITSPATCKIVKTSNGNSTQGIAIGSPVAGATYGLYRDQGCTTLVETASTGSDGKCSFTIFPNETFYVRELSAPSPHIVDDTVYPVSAGYGKTTTLNLRDSSGGSLLINKLKRPQNATYRMRDADIVLAGTSNTSHISGSATVKDSNQSVSYLIEVDNSTLDAGGRASMSFDIPLEIKYMDDVAAYSDGMLDGSVETSYNDKTLTVSGLSGGKSYEIRFNGKIVQGWGAKAVSARLLTVNSAGAALEQEPITAPLSSKTMAGAEYTIYVDEACTIEAGDYDISRSEFAGTTYVTDAACEVGKSLRIYNTVTTSMPNRIRYRLLNAGGNAVQMVNTQSGLAVESSGNSEYAAITMQFPSLSRAGQKWTISDHENTDLYPGRKVIAAASDGSLYMDDTRYLANDSAMMCPDTRGYDFVLKTPYPKIVLDSDGIGKFGNAAGQMLSPGRTYYVKETKAPDGYDLDPSVYAIVPESNKTTVLNVTDTFTSIEIQKQTHYPWFSDYDSRYSIEGAEYDLYDADPETFPDASPIYTFVTNASGICRLDGVMPDEAYWIRERKPSKGLMLDETTYKVDAARGSLNIMELKEDIPVEVSLSKRSTQPVPNIPAYTLEGGVFEIYTSREDAEERTNAVERLETDEQGCCPTVTLPMKDYFVREVEPPYGYYINDEIKHITVYDFAACTSQSRTFDNIPRPISIQMRKTAALETVDEPLFSSLVGATFEVYETQADALGGSNPLASTVSDENGACPSMDLPPRDAYYVRETKSPENYQSNSNVFEMRASDNLTLYLEVEDPALPVSLTIEKKSSDERTSKTNYSLEGAVFGIYANEEDALARENEIRRTTTGADGRTESVTGLKAQAYWVAEISAPRGFYIAQPPICVHFETSRDVTATFTDEPRYGYIFGQKRSSDPYATPDTNSELFSYEGAEFALYENAKDASEAPDGEAGDKALMVLKSDGSGNVRNELPIVPGEYYLREIKAPEGYMLSHAVIPIEAKEDTSETSDGGETELKRTAYSFQSKNRVLAKAVGSSDVEDRFVMSSYGDRNLQGYDSLAAAKLYKSHFEQGEGNEACLDFDVSVDGTIRNGVELENASSQEMLRNKTPLDFINANYRFQPSDDVIAVIDSGIDPTRVRSSNIAGTASVLYGRNAATDACGHGTDVVSEMVLRDISTKVFSVKAFDENGVGTVSSVASGMEAARLAGCSRIYLPLDKAEVDSSVSTSLLDDAIARALNEGISILYRDGSVDKPGELGIVEQGGQDADSEQDVSTSSKVAQRMSSRRLVLEDVAPTGSEVFSLSSSTFFSSGSNNLENLDAMNGSNGVGEFEPVKRAEYTVRYNLNGGSHPDQGHVFADRKSYYDAEVEDEWNIPGDAPSRDGFEFVGWITRQPLEHGGYDPLVVFPGEYVHNMKIDTDQNEEEWRDIDQSLASFSEIGTRFVELVAIWVDSDGNYDTDGIELHKTETMTSSTAHWYSSVFGVYFPNSSSTPTYLATNPYTGDKAYTLSYTEYSNVVNAGWTGNGVYAYSDDARAIPVYRFYSAYYGNHSYSITNSPPWSYEREQECAYGLSWYRLAYNGNGQTSGDNYTTSDYFQYGISYPYAQNTFAKTGYLFNGWRTPSGSTSYPGWNYANLAHTGGNGWNNGSLATATIYALWTPIHYTISFDGNGADAGQVASIGDVAYDTDTVLPKSGCTKLGYELESWNTAADGSGDRYELGATVRNLSDVDGSTVTLYAQWKPVPYPIHYDPVGGEGEMADDNPLMDSDFTLPACTFTKNNCEFVGWSTIKPCGESKVVKTEFEDGATVRNIIGPSGETTLYAVWKSVISSDPAALRIDDDPVKTMIRVSKLPSGSISPFPGYMNNYSMEGAEFGIYSTREEAEAATPDVPGSPIATLVTDEYGIAKTEDVVIGREYFIKELKAPANGMYSVSNTVFETGTVQENEPVDIVLREYLLPVPNEFMHIKVRKETLDTGGSTLTLPSGTYSVEGTMFGLYSSEQDAIDDVNSLEYKSVDASGELVFDELVPGEYWVKEKSAAPGFKYDGAPQKVLVREWDDVEAQEPVAVFQDDIVTVGFSIQKASSAPSSETGVIGGGYSLNGAVFGVYLAEEDAKNGVNALMELTSDENGKCTIDGLYPRTYYVRETSAPPHYGMDGNVYAVTPPISGAEPIVNISDTPLFSCLSVSKSSDADISGIPGMTLLGAEFGIYSDSACMNEVARLSTSADGQTKSVKVLPGTYYAKELAAPMGHALSSEAKSVSVESGESGKFEFEDHAMLGQIEISKASNRADWLDGDLSGAVFGVFSDAETTRLVETVKTDSTGQAATSSLPCGEYFVKEMRSLDGHASDETIYPVSVLDGEVAKVNNGEPVVNETGSIRLHKSAEEQYTGLGYSLSGAVYGIYRSPDCPVAERVGRMVTGDDGWTDEYNLLAPGTYYIREESAPYGWAVDQEAHPVEVTASSGADSLPDTIDVQEQPVLSDVPVRVLKVNAETCSSLEQGNISTSGARFRIDYYRESTSDMSVLDSLEPARTWKLETCADGTTSLDSEHLVEDSDPLYFAEDKPVIPLGTIVISEEKAPDGMLLGTAGNEEGASARLFNIQEDVIIDNSGTSHLDVLEATFEDSPMRGNVKFRKTDNFGNAMAHMPFVLSLLGENGDVTESHLVFTDENGEYDSASPSTGSVNADDGLLVSSEDIADDGSPLSTYEVPLADEHDPSSTVWFSGSSDTATLPSGERGALLHGSYKMEEAHCPGNSAYVLPEPIYFDIALDSEEVDLGDIVNVKPQLSWTSALDRSTQSKYGRSLGSHIDDLVQYDDLVPGDEYMLTGALYDVDTSLPITNEDTFALGTTVMLVPEEPSGQLTMSYDTSQFDLDGKTVSIKISMTHMGKTKDEHNVSLGDVNETLMYPEVFTSAVDNGTNSRQGSFSSDGKASITDTVSYKNLEAGKQYSLTGTLMSGDGDAASSIAGADGKPVSSTVNFTSSDTGEGIVEVPLEVSVDQLAGVSRITVFETLYNEDGVDIAQHADIGDVQQTVTYPSISTLAGGYDVNVPEGSEKQDCGHDVPANRCGLLYDEVTYSMLDTGCQYRLRGWFVHKSDGSMALDNQGKALQQELYFTPKESSGTVRMDFDARNLWNLAGSDIVAFEELYKVEPDGTETLAAVHRDISAESQRVHLIAPSDTFDMPFTGGNGVMTVIAVAGMAIFAGGIAAMLVGKRSRKREEPLR